MIAISNNSEPPPKIKTLFSSQALLQKNPSNPNHPTTKMLKCVYPPLANMREVCVRNYGKVKYFTGHNSCLDNMKLLRLQPAACHSDYIEKAKDIFK